MAGKKLSCEASRAVNTKAATRGEALGQGETIMAIEKRIFTASFSLRAKSKGTDDMSLEGYAAKFGVMSHPISNNGGPFREIIARGAFTRALATKQDVIATIQHDPSSVLGRTKSGTLTLKQDDTGLAFRITLDPRQQVHRDLHAGVERGDWDACSWAFSVPDGGETWSDGTDENGQRCTVRTLKDVNLHDVAIVQGPAYPQTSVNARALAYYGPQGGVVTRRQTAEFVQQILQSPADAEMRKQRHQRAREICAQYPELSIETIARGLRLDYSEDTFLSLRFAALSEQLRAGGAFEVGPMRDGGQAADPQQTLRFKPSDAASPEEHERAVGFHRACASRAYSMETCSNHHGCADAHDLAAKNFTAENSAAARAASKRARY